MLGLTITPSVESVFDVPSTVAEVEANSNPNECPASALIERRDIKVISKKYFTVLSYINLHLSATRHRLIFNKKRPALRGPKLRGVKLNGYKLSEIDRNLT